MNLQTIIDSYNKYHKNIKVEIDFAFGVCIIDDASRIPVSSIYELLQNPKYGYRQTFDKDPEMQKAFWEWMIGNGDATFDEDIGDNGSWLIRECNSDAFYRPTPQAETGYIQKFIEGIIKTSKRGVSDERTYQDYYIAFVL